MPRGSKKGKVDIDRLLGAFDVECIDDRGVERRLTKGKIYKVFEVKAGCYRIRTDTNRLKLFSIGFFRNINK